MKKLLAMVLALVMTLSLATVSSNAAFKDADKVNETYAEAVEVLNGLKVFQGYEDGSFNPTGDITRAEVAAIVYRVYTTDVKDTYVKNYETYNKFSDMNGAGWAKGYIGYCANAEFVKGYPDGTFQPSGKVTGYEVLAMILRAVGYDKNNEFSGADWALHVAQIAEQAKILKNVKGIDLNKAATRELVAELLFQAIQTPMVTYTAAFGYQNVSLTSGNNLTLKDNATLGYKNFKLVGGVDYENDIWGRPVKVWAKDKNDDGKYTAADYSNAYTTIAVEPDAAFNVATSECDICEALSEKTSATIKVAYVNGKDDSDAAKALVKTLSATATKATVGKQGQQIEFYSVTGGYRLVVIDTYLAKVASVITEKTDAKGHITRDDCLALTVYTAKNESTTLYVEGNDYAEGDYLLVNVNENKTVSFTGVNGEKKTNYVEVVGKADSLTAAQTTIRYNSNKHTIDSKDYYDACKFFLNEAGTTANVKFTWFFDQFGNVIGSAALDRDSYAVLKSIKWIDAASNGYAQATLITFDGKLTEETVKVAKIDGFDATAANYKWLSAERVSDAAEDKVPYLKDDSGNVVTSAGAPVGEDEASSNKAYRGLALYKVVTLDDGSVELQGFDTTSTLYVDAVKGATVNAKSSKITFTQSNSQSDTRDSIIVTDETEFIVRTGSVNNYKYTAYTGTEELPAMASGSVRLMYNYDSNPKVADFVYISDFTPAVAEAKLMFVYQGSYTQSGSNYKMSVLLDGEESYVVGTEAQMETLAANVGKLFKITTALTTGNELANENAFDLVNCKTKDTSLTDNENDGLAYQYLLNASKLDNQSVLHSGSYDFYAKDATVYVWNEKLDENGAYEKTTFSALTNSQLEDAGVWVVETKDIDVATAIYVGQKLSSDTSLSGATWKYSNTDRGSLTFNSSNAASVPLGTDETVSGNVSVSLTASNKNAYFDYSTDKWLCVTASAPYTAVYETTETSFTSTTQKTITLTAEDGSKTETYKVTFTDGYQRCDNVSIEEDESDNHTFTVSLGHAASGSENTITYVNTVTVDIKDNAAVTTAQLLDAMKLSGHNDPYHNYGCNLELISTSGNTTAAGNLSIDRNDLFFKVTTEKNTTAYYKVVVIDSTIVTKHNVTQNGATTRGRFEVTPYENVTAGTDVVVKVTNTETSSSGSNKYSLTVTYTNSVGEVVHIYDQKQIVIDNQNNGASYVQVSFTMPNYDVNVSLTLAQD